MAKKTSSTWESTGSSRLYTVDDVRKVNAMRVHYCKSSVGKWNVEHSRAYSAKELNSAWKKVTK